MEKFTVEVGTTGTVAQGEVTVVDVPARFVANLVLPGHREPAWVGEGECFAAGETLVELVEVGTHSVTFEIVDPDDEWG